MPVGVQTQTAARCIPGLSEIGKSGRNFALKQRVLRSSRIEIDRRRFRV